MDTFGLLHSPSRLHCLVAKPKVRGRRGGRTRESIKEVGEEARGKVDEGGKQEYLQL